MASADNRIVKLEFDNSSFEKNVATTLGTIGKLNEAIGKIGSGGGFKEIEAASKGFSLDTMTSAIEGVSAKFIALSTIGITALANLTNKAVDAGITIAKSLSMDQVTAGFAEYELKLGSIQTIMAGSGADLATVNAKLQELNTYSDKTIYSFADMTTNIGKFTNAGVDLDTAVASIQGIANVAAVSGANSEEASRAMYNFAQALSKGHVQLLDWKSIELANMGTVEFKQQLIDAAEATGTLTKQGDKWVTSTGTMVSATEGFNESLTDQWLTTDVLTGTLSDYADETTAIGAKATAAAQDVKTFSQLMSTVKESIGSGWAQSFEILIGNFDEAKALFTGINTVIGDYVGKNADARNELLQGWKDMGGRTRLIEGLQAGFKALADVITPIKEAFRDIFPAMTAERLYALTDAFATLMENLRPSAPTIENIKRIFKGFFAVLEIGWVILKTAAGAIVDLIQELTGLGGGAALSGLAKVGDFFTELNAKLVEGGGIVAFFERMKEAIQGVIPFVLEIKDAIVDFVGGLDFSSASGFFQSISDAFDGISFDTSVFDPIIELWDKFLDSTGKAGDALRNFGDIVADIWNNVSSGIGGAIGGIMTTIGDAFGGIIDNISGMFKAGGELENKVKESADGIDWAMVLGGVGAALVGGLIVTINRLVSKGINIDFTGGVLSSISGTFDQLTGTLKTMQQDIKADVLLKIAGAIGVLALSMVALSFIDADKLAKSAVAIAVAFGQLAVAMKIMEKMNFSVADAAKFTLMAVAFGILGGGMILLAGATALFATMSWEELAKGGAAFAVVVTGIIAMSKLIENEASGMIKASVAMILMGLSMDTMYRAVKKFGELDTGVLVQGFIGLATAMGLLVATMQLLPDDLERKTAGVLGFSIALNVMVLAIKLLGSMDLGELVQGGIAFAGMLTVLVLALRLMPSNMMVTAGQLLALAVAVGIMAVAMKVFGSMSWEEMIKGLVGMAGALGILVAAMMLASGGLVGAAAILIMSVALLALSLAIKAFAAIGLKDFAIGMLLVVVALAALAGVALLLAPAVPAMLGLGLALAAIGVGFALIGVGAAQVAKALAILAGIEDIGGVITETLGAIGAALPALFSGIAKGIGEFIITLTGFIPDIVKFGVDLISALLEGLSQVVPDLLEFIGSVIQSLLDLIIEMVPQFATAGLEILIGILEGLREAIPRLVTVVGEIITGFLDALAEQLPQIVDSVANLFIELLTSVAENVGEVAGSLMFGMGISFMQGFLDGLSDSLGMIWDWFLGLVDSVIGWVKSGFGIASPSTVMDALGVDLIVGFLNGIISAAADVITWFTELAGNVIEWIGNVTRTIWDKGTDFITGLLGGIAEKALAVTRWFNNLAGDVLRWIGNVASTVWQKGVDFIQGLINGINNKIGEVTSFFTGLISDVLGWIGSTLSSLKSKGTGFISGLWDGVKDKWEDVKGWFQDLDDKALSAIGDLGSVLKNAGKAIINGLWNGMKEIWNNVTSWLGGLGDVIPDWKGPPKKDAVILYENGKLIFQGLQHGMEDEWENVTKWLSEVDPASEMDKNMGARMAQVLNDSMSEIDINPTITPVLDLTQVQQDAKKLEKMLPATATLQAGIIAGYNPGQAQVTDNTTATPEINFNQTINAPKQLSTVDIYRQTRNQIAMAKEELNIP